MKRCIHIHVFLFFGLFLFLIPVAGRGYLLSPSYVLKRMVQNYHSLQSVTVTQRVEVFGEDTAYPFASVDEKVEMHPLVPLKIWVGGKAVTLQTDIEAEFNFSRFLIDAQRRYGFYKDVFLSHELNLLKVLLKRLEIIPVQDRLRLVYPDIAYQIGNGLTGETPKGLWVDKKRYIPLRLVGILSGRQEGKPFQEDVDIRYGDYRLLQGGIWYPFDVKFFINGKLSLRIRAFSVSLTTN